MALDGVYAVLPLLIMIMIGFGAAARPWFGREGMNFLSKINMIILIPVYMFSNVTRLYQDPQELLELARNIPYPFIVVGSGIALAALLAIPLKLRPPQRGVFINCAGLSNVVVMGLPVALSLFGDRSLPYLMMYYACNTTVWWTLGVWILRREVPGSSGRGVASALLQVLATPPFMGFLIGIVWVILGIPAPKVVATTMASVGACVTPLAMIFIGAVIRFADFRNIGKVRSLRILLPYKYVITPALAGFLCWLLPLPLLMKQVFFVLANMPGMAQLPIMAKEVGTDYEFASLATALMTALSMVTVPLYIFLMEYTGIFA